jgi:serine/threonine-protein kinase
VVVPRIIANRFELVDRIGRGAMGEVWAAIDHHTNQDVAVKVAQPWSLSEPDLVARFEREGKLLRRIRSPFICSLVDAGRTENDVPYIVLERLVGETLDELLKRERYLSLEEVGKIADEILQALTVAHAAGIVHRDLSPSNVFLHRRRSPDDPSREEIITKVLDFGIAKAEDTASSRTGSSATMGSLPFAAPEQLGDSARAGPRADLYAVGTIVFYALAGRLPFGSARGTSLIVLKREHDPPTIDEVTGERWPAALRTFLVKTMARLPSKRYPSAEVALASLREALRGRGPALEPPETSPDAPSTLTVGPPRVPPRRR